MRRLLLTLAALGCAAAIAGAQEAGGDGALVIERAELVQGGYVIGRVAEGATARLVEGAAEPVLVPIDADGGFLIGFDRDGAAEATLIVERGGREIARRRFAVEPRTYAVQRIDGLPDRVVTPTSEEDLAKIRADGEIKRAARATEHALDGYRAVFSWPVKGPVTGVYGSQRILNGEPRRPHYGVDIAPPRGTPVTAPAPGVVTLAQADMFYEGGLVFLDHGGGLVSALLHLQDIVVAPGDRVEAGAVIGHVGATGRATGPHLDWRMSWRGRQLDPGLFAPGSPAG